MTDTDGLGVHWDAAYARGGPGAVSWYTPITNVPDLLAAQGCSPTDRVLDVGGGASPLVGALLDRGYLDLSVLDVSATALEEARAQLGERAAAIRWVIADVRTWSPPATYDVWHDRAVFHLHVEDRDRAAYLTTLRGATAPGSLVVLATFALDGPSSCSGLPVRRYDAAQLAAALGPDFEPVHQTREEHRTPWDTVQPFTRATFRRQR
ncbi:MAG: class I SAM-dependent methyltransferase [Sporichthyaceae bacterium]